MEAVQRDIQRDVKEDAAWQMAAVVRVIVQALVDRPDDVKVETIVGRGAVMIEVDVHPDDLRKVIGIRGDAANAIRTLLGKFAGKAGMRASLELIEPVR
jgi:predicted RNA-binding protein YlqC (UPF0109 family)